MKSNFRAIWLSILTGIAASLCCITPILALVAGSTGLTTTFAWIEPFRPYLVFLTLLILGYAWYQKLKPQKREDCGCEPGEKQKFIQSKLFLGLVTIFTFCMLSFPYYSKVFYAKISETQPVVDESSINRIELGIEGMTCVGCEGTVTHQINQLEGILSSEISYENGNAIIEYDQSKTSEKEISQVIISTGYTVTQNN